MLKRQRISTLIKQLEKVKEKEGNLFVYYASQHDWAVPIFCIGVEEDPGWDYAPKIKTLYLC